MQCQFPTSLAGHQRLRFELAGRGAPFRQFPRPASRAAFNHLRIGGSIVQHSRNQLS